MAERTFTVFGPSKEVRLTGMRVGYVVVPPAYLKKMQEATNNAVGKTGTLSMISCIAAYEHLETYTKEWMRILDNRRKVGQKILDSIPNVSCSLPEAGFSFWLNVGKLGTSADILTYLVKEAGVGVGSGTWFCDHGEVGCRGEGYLRVMFVCYKDDEIIFEACRRISKALRKFQGIN